MNAADVPALKETAEIRWFFAEPPFDPADVFPPSCAGPWRVDWYAFPCHEGCGIKIREGRLETKLRQTVYPPGTEAAAMTARTSAAPPPLEGVLESWTKWSVTLPQDVPPPTDRLLRETGWVEVHKQRFLRSFAVRENMVVEMDQRPAEGCELEWTHLRMGDMRWWTLGLESVGARDDLANYVGWVLQDVLAAAVPPRVLFQNFRRENSCGYPEWLLRQLGRTS